MNSPAKRAIVIGMDGASMELVQNMVDWGHMPHLARLMEEGVYRPMIGVFPTLTPPGWTATSTGSWPGTHKVMDFNIRKVGGRLDETVWGINTGLSQSEYLWNTLERANKKPILVKWEMSWPPTVETGVQIEGTGPGVSNHHQIAGYHLFVGGKWAPRPIGGQRDPETLDPSALQTVRNIDPVTIAAAEDWDNLPNSALAPRQVELTIRPLARGRGDMLRGKEGTPKTFYGLIYATGDGYDRVRVCRSRDGGDAVADLGAGDWSEWWLDGFGIDGEQVEGYMRMKLVGLSPSADMFELFSPQIWPREGYSKPAEVAGEIDAEVGNFLQNPARDALGVVDDDTYFELLDFHHQRLADVAEYLTQSRQWDALFIESHASDYASHFFLAQADEISGADPQTLARCRDGVARTFASIDAMIGRLTELADDDAVIAVVSDHGGTPNQHRYINVSKVLEETGFLVYKEGEGGEREIDWTKTLAADVGLVHIFVNLKGREPTGIVEPDDYEQIRLDIIEALHTYREEETGRCPFALALTREDAEMLNLWGELTGDVVYALRPEFDGAHGKQLPTAQLGIGGQHCTFVLAGAGVRRRGALQRQVRAVDVAPTLCFLLGVPMPRDVEGGVVYEALEEPDWHLSE